jgi:CubicO group peptidase (beta-lactamase class C family)
MESPQLDRRTFIVAGGAGAATGLSGSALADTGAETGTEGASARSSGRSRPVVSGGGFSQARLGRIEEVLARHVDSGRIPGAVAAVRRHGHTHAVAVGTMAFGSEAPMARDTIFRIASLSKPIAAAAAMTLVEQALLRLDDPVDEWLPELAGRRVLRTIDSEIDDTVPARRAITLRDLLTHRLGLGAIMVFPPTLPIQEAMSEAGVAPGPYLPEATPDDYMRAIGSLPLAHQPGEGWLYDTGAHVLGVLLARASGQPLETFLRDHVLAPLGMEDTGFSVPEAKIDRLPLAYWTDIGSGELSVFDEARGGRFAEPPAFESASGGLVSTVDDLLAFGEMMLNGGAFDGGRVLSPATVELMTRDHIAPEQKAVSPLYPEFWDTRGWGFNMAVVTRRDDIGPGVGSFGWDGGYGTSFYCDPAEDLVGVLLTQRVWESPIAPPQLRDFWTAAYQAITE